MEDVIFLGTKSSYLSELFFFHLFYIHSRLLALPKLDKSPSLDWEIQFLLNSFVVVENFLTSEKAALSKFHNLSQIHPSFQEHLQSQDPILHRELPHGKI